MNIVFYLSEAVDFRPFYHKKLPPEIFPWQNGTLFSELYSIFTAAFPDADFYVIDGSDPSVFFEIFDEPGVLNFPTSSLFSKIFLFSSFCLAYQLPPFTLFIPANLVIREPDKLIATIRKIARNDLGASAWTFYSQNEAVSGFALEASHKMSDRDLLLFSLGKFIPQFAVRKELEENPESLYYYGADIFTLSAMKWGEALREIDENLGELFYLLVNAWRDKASMKTVMRDVIAELSQYKLEDIVRQTVDKLVCPVGDIYQKLVGLSDYLLYLPTDENGNYCEGNVVCDDVAGSIVINRSPFGLSVHRERHFFFFADGKTVNTGRF